MTLDKEKQEKLKSKLQFLTPLSNLTGKQKVRVIARIRPYVDHEHSSSFPIFTNITKTEISIASPRSEQESLLYKLDACFDEKVDQLELFQQEIFPLLKYIMQGINVSVFAYGNTGAGKTFTMLGNDKKQGIIPRTVRQLFTTFTTSLSNLGSSLSKKYTLKVSFFEIYNEKVYDLIKFNGQDLPIREDLQKQILIPGLSIIAIDSFDEFQRIFSNAIKNRTTAATSLNVASSRSHSVLTLMVESLQDDGNVIRSKMHLIDLAGSEDNRKTENSGIRLVESSAINKSLFVLGKVVDALNAGETRIPYRDSKLTRILQDSLGGKSQALMIANISPCEKFHVETFNTLNFASKSKQIRNNVSQQQSLPANASQFVTSYPANKALQRIQNGERSVLLSPIIKRKKVISEELMNRCEELERKMILKEGKVPVLLESPPQRKISPNSKKRLKKLHADAKEFENNFDYAGAIDCLGQILQITTNDEKLEKKLASLKRTHDSIVSQMLKTCKTQNRNAIEDSPFPAANTLYNEAVDVQSSNAIARENLENVFFTPNNQLIPSPSSLALEKGTTDSLKKKQIVEKELVYIFNHGTKTELMKIKGIGNKRAEQIAAYRITKGSFSSIEDFLQIEGFTQKILDNILLLKVAETILSE